MIFELNHSTVHTNRREGVQVYWHGRCVAQHVETGDDDIVAPRGDLAIRITGARFTTYWVPSERITSF